MKPNSKILQSLGLFLMLGTATVLSQTNTTARLEGTWIIDSIVRDPPESKPDEGKGLEVLIKGDAIVVKTPESGERFGGLIFKVNANATPATVDFWVDETPFGKSREKILQEPPVLAIYEVKGDILRVCWSPLEDRTRPAEFACRPG